ncbi:MAG: DEAD/DEAH box helicase [Caldilineae bacterium]|nr:MAG: DEAD/DEAH box helicase [Caldilineae bacterium]
MVPSSPSEDALHLVLHLHWRPPAHVEDEPRFWVWAECGDAPQPRRQRGRPAARPKPKPHPFILAEAGALRRVLQHFDPAIITQGLETFTLHLPSTRTGPLPSPRLIHNWDLVRQDVRLAPWYIQGLRLSRATTLTLLDKLRSCACPEHLVLGDDLLFWRKVFNLVLQVLTQQHYIPSIVSSRQDADGFYGVWKPVLDTGEVHDTAISLAKAMPPLCRSELGPDDEEPAPLYLLKEFAAQMTDHLVREWGSKAPHRLGYLHNQNGVAAWLKSLVQPNPRISAPGGQLHLLADQISTWQRNLAPAGNTSFTIALKLQAPASISTNGHLYVPETGWRLDYLLQARDDPTLQVPAQQVWQSQDETLTFHQYRFTRAQEKLLQGLGRAAYIFAPIERSLQDPAPTGVDLNTTEVYSFLREAAPLLRQSGFSLILPPWWEAAGARLGLKLYLSPTRPEPPDVVKDPDSPVKAVAYRWELVLGDTTLTREAFADLVSLRSPLVQKDGRWLRLDPEQIEAAERFWQRHSFEGKLDLQRALRVALGLDEHFDIAGLPVHKVILEGWLPEVIRRLTEGDDRLREAIQPLSLRGMLRPYQRYGYAWLHTHRHLGLGACLADDMGLGKSVQAISLLLREQIELGDLPQPTLLICPTSLLGNWRREFERFAPHLRVFIHYGPERPRNGDFAATVSKYDVVLTSYSLARRDAEWVQQYTWYGLILDEAQKIKNPQTQITQVVNQIPAQFRVALTGTPVENRLTELWSIFNFLNKGYLGSEASFRKQFAYPIERYQDPIVTSRLQRLVRPFILRRHKSDPSVIQDLPERLEFKVYCTLSEEQAELYQKVVEEGLPRIADSRGSARRIHVFNLLMRLKQILNHPVQYHYKISADKIPAEELERRSGKLDRLTSMLEEVLENDDRALVFTQFAEMGHLLVAHIQQQFDCKVFYLHGSVPAKKRQQMITQFQEDPHAPPVFVLTLGTGGLGLNLTAATHVFHYDRWWNPAVENQASDRAFRIGQTRNVQIHKFITAGTVEEAIDEMIERKKGLAEAIIGTDEGWIAALSDEELAELVTLNKERM